MGHFLVGSLQRMETGMTHTEPSLLKVIKLVGLGNWILGIPVGSLVTLVTGKPENNMKKEDIEKKLPSTSIGEQKESFVLDRYQLRQFIQQGCHRFVCKDGQEIELLYHPYAYRLESGVTMPSEDESKKDEYSLEHFFDYPKRKEWTIPLLEPGARDQEIIKWMIDHLTAIQDVVGFPLQNVKVKEEINETIGFFGKVIIDISAEDINREKIVMSGDRKISRDNTLICLLCSAILIEAKKIIWVANEIKEDHQIIVKWLNEYFSKRINIYLVEAKSVSLDDEKYGMCQFRLVESPTSGWINHY